MIAFAPLERRVFVQDPATRPSSSLHGPIWWSCARGPVQDVRTRRRGDACVTRSATAPAQFQMCLVIDAYGMRMIRG
jgi:hypothetical protein